MQDVTQIANHWRRLEGSVVGERYRLSQCLAGAEDNARFAAESDEDGPVTVQIDKAGVRYQTPGLEHPNLLRVLDTGRTEVEGEEWSYVVTEPVDETLAEVLAERALSPGETREMLGEVLHALGWLHSHGVAHGNVNPRAIAATGDTIKLSAAIRNPDDGNLGGPYDPPESAISPAGDVWSLGTTMFEALTKRLPAEAADLAALPPPFYRVALNTLVSEPASRWSVDRISGYLSSSSAMEPAPPAAAEPAPQPETPPPAAFRKWGYALLAAAAFAVVAVALRPAGENRLPPATAKAPASRTAAPPPAPAADAPEKPAPYEIPEAAPVPRQIPQPSIGAAREERQVWRVIVYTFAQQRQAEQKAATINRQFPKFEAEVFQPNDSSPYLVVIGGRMSREEAIRVRDAARAGGLASDAYVQNYSR